MTKPTRKTGKKLEKHDSGLRSLVEGANYKSFATLEEAKSEPNAALILEGDYGGTIYMTCPVSAIRCGEPVLRKLLELIDSVYWDDMEGAGVYFEPRKTTEGIWGGMGGGVVASSIWIHPKIVAHGLEYTIRTAILNSDGGDAFDRMPAHRYEVLKEYPIRLSNDAWFARIEAVEGAVLASATDCWGRKIEIACATREEALGKLNKIAIEIQHQIVKSASNPAKL
jgi:hypothetical protein